MTLCFQMNRESGFLTNQTKNPNIIGEVEPYQFNSNLRSNSTLRFYRNLDLESCLWEFVGYYNLSELITECGGTISTDGQVGERHVRERWEANEYRCIFLIHDL